MNKVLELIKSMERPNFPFVPNQILYDATGIKRKRFAKIIRGEISPTITELKAIADYFNVKLNSLIS